jgi:hypothetical protein
MLTARWVFRLGHAAARRHADAGISLEVVFIFQPSIEVISLYVHFVRDAFEADKLFFQTVL